MKVFFRFSQKILRAFLKNFYESFLEAFNKNLNDFFWSFFSKLLKENFFNSLLNFSQFSVFGSASAPPRGEWTRTGLTFGTHASQDPYPFGLKCPKNATRGLVSVIQAFLIKFFIFDNRPKEKSVPLEKLLRPTEADQTCALWNSIAEILWNVGEKTKTCVCLPGDVPHISHSHQYFQDNVTEKVRRIWILVFCWEFPSRKFIVFLLGFFCETSLTTFSLWEFLKRVFATKKILLGKF